MPFSKMPTHIANNPIYAHIYGDVHGKDLDALIAVCGRRGHCKSGSALRFGEDIDLDSNGDTRFDVSHVFFRASEFVSACREKHPAGTALIWDEVGVENDARDWYSLKNKLIKHVMETNRYRNYIILITVPVLGSMDVSTRRLLSGYLEMWGKIGDKRQAKGKFEFVQTNPKTGKIYYKAPRYWNDGHLYVLKTVVVPKPSLELETAYKKKKEEYTENLWKNIEMEMDFMSKTVGWKASDTMKTLNELEQDVLKNPNEFFYSVTQKFSASLIESKLNATQFRSRQLATLLNIKLSRKEILPPVSITATIVER